MKHLGFLLILTINFSCIEQSKDKHSTIEGFDPATQSCQSFSNYEIGQSLTPCTDFKGVKLLNLDFSNTDLRGSDFSNIVINGVNFNNADLSGAKFFKTQINKTTFNEAKLDNVTFKDSQISEVTMIKIQGSKITLEDSKLFDINLNQAYIPGIKMINSQIINAYLVESFLENSIWSSVTLRESNLTQSKMAKSKIRNSDFSTNIVEFLQDQSNSAQLIKANLLDGIDLRESIIEFSNFNLASMQRSRLQKSRIYKSLFQGINLEESALTYSIINEVNFSSIIGTELTAHQKTYFIQDNLNNYILKQKTKINYVEAHNASITYSLLNHIEMNQGNWVQSNFSYSSSSYSEIQDNQFNESGFYQSKFFKNQMRSNNFYRSNLGVEQYLSIYPQGTFSVEFIESDLSFSVFDQVLWHFENINTQYKFGPNFSKSIIINSFWNYSDIRFGSLEGTDSNFSNLQNALNEGIRFNQETKLPFSRQQAIEFGMVLNEE